MVDKAEVLARQDSYDRREPFESSAAMSAAPTDFSETEGPMSEDEAFLGAARCLDCGVCSECHACVDACPADAIKLDMRGERDRGRGRRGRAGHRLQALPADAKPQYGYGRYKNVITGMQMDRLLAPTRPYNAVLRPSDGKVPDNIAYVMCTGSRDETVGNPLCSKICCMYSVKQNQLIMGALPLADVTVYYIDVRSVGKGYDEFYEQAKDMGANFVKGRVSGITETEEGNLVLRYEDIENGGALAEAEHDLVVLAVGVQPNGEAPAAVRRRRSRSRRLLLRRRGRRGPGPRPDQPARRVRRRGRRPAPRTSPIPSSTRAPRWPRPPPTWRGRR